MKGIKKFLIIFFVVLLILLVIGWVFMNNKQEKSIALSQYIPESQYVARLNTKEAIRLLLSLEKDSFIVNKKSKWSAIFRDSENTGIDMLVNPWVFGTGKQLNFAFSLKSVTRFHAWMSTICDSTNGAWLNKEDSIYFFHFTGPPISFYHNKNGVALMSFGNNSESIANSFFGNPKTSSNKLEMKKELIQVKLSKDAYFMDSLFSIHDSVIKLYIAKDYLKINDGKVPDFKDAVILKKLINRKNFTQLKNNKVVEGVFQYLGLKEVELSSDANLILVLEDTLQRHINTVSYEFNDDFEKVKIVKKSTSILPNISLQFEFENTERATQFYELNKLKEYKSEMFYARQIGKLVFISSTLEPRRHDWKDAQSIIYLNKKKCEFVLNGCKGFGFISFEALNGMDYLYLNQSEGNTSLTLKCDVHPVQFLHNNFSEKMPW